MPPSGAFTDIEAYYSTLAHELTHWTGHKARLAREFGKRFGSQAYAFEELIAEMGAAYAMARLGIGSEPREDHASYLASWLKVLKSDKRAIFTAASKAQAACDLLFDLADKGRQEAPERPAAPTNVICLPYLPLPVSEPENGLVEDDGDDNPTPPFAPCPSTVSTGVADGFSTRMARFSGGRIRAYHRSVRKPDLKPLERQSASQPPNGHLNSSEGPAAQMWGFQSNTISRQIELPL